MRLIRQLARLYGRPSRHARHDQPLAATSSAIFAITGGMAVGDSLCAADARATASPAKLSQRLGEGVLNGLLTARLGLAAIDVTRPLPFTALPAGLRSAISPRICCASATARSEVRFRWSASEARRVGKGALAPCPTLHRRAHVLRVGTLPPSLVELRARQVALPNLRTSSHLSGDWGQALMIAVITHYYWSRCRNSGM